jgi:Mrp family chromosome partitioning ATPase
MLSALRQLEGRADTFAPQTPPLPVADDEPEVQIAGEVNSVIAAVAEATRSHESEHHPAAEAKPPHGSPAQILPEFDPSADHSPAPHATPGLATAPEPEEDSPRWMQTEMIPAVATPKSNPQHALRPGSGITPPTNPEAPLWMPTVMIPALQPQNASPQQVLSESQTGTPSPAFDGLAALLGQPAGIDHLAPEHDDPPLAKVADAPKPQRTPAEDRGQSLSPLEARIKRNSIQDPLAGQMRTFSRKVIQQFSGIQPATVLFVGADVGDHTSVVAAHLAALLAEQQQGDILLVDADVARRTLSAGFGRDNHRGLAELLGDALTDGQSPIHSTITPDLSILPCGRGAFPAATHLETRIPLLLSGLSERWPWIVVQGGAADSALTAAFAGACQGTYLLVRLGQTSPTEAAESLSILNTAGACILGCVATNVP